MQNQPLRELSLFSGAGGGILGSILLGHRIVGAVERDEYCCRVLEQRQRDGVLERFPIFQTDIRDFIRHGYAELYQGRCDLVSAGFPCQPFSLAGKRQGAADERNGWPATIECLRVVRPQWALLENVPGLVTSGYFGTILGDLAESGFDCRWRILSAAEMGAPHRRDRLWIMAYARSSRLGGSDSVQSHRNQERDNPPSEQSGHTKPGVTVSGGEDVADTKSVGQREQADKANAIATSGQAWHEPGDSGKHAAHAERQGLAFGEGEEGQRSQPTITRGDWWAAESDVGRTLDGLARWLDFPESH